MVQGSMVPRAVTTPVKVPADAVLFPDRSSDDRPAAVVVPGVFFDNDSRKCPVGVVLTNFFEKFWSG